jgi:adenosine kinase
VRIAVSGSIASDHLMTFPGSFTEHLIADRLDRVSLSFLADELEVRRGGVAANICFGLGLLGLSPLLVGAVGPDFSDHQAWLSQHGVDTSGVHVSSDKRTARFVCTTDSQQNQIATFYAGAMAQARDIALPEVARRCGGIAMAVISPNDPQAMVRHTRESREHGYPFLADPSQQLARTGGDTVRELVDGAAGLFTNEYERELLMNKTGWLPEEVMDRVGLWVTTLGPDGAVVFRKEADPVRVPAVPVREIAEPTGAGDAFRAGFIAGLAWDLGDLDCARLGCAMAALALEAVGPQEYRFDRADLLRRLGEAYGPQTPAAIAPHLPPAAGTGPGGLGSRQEATSPAA